MGVINSQIEQSAPINEIVGFLNKFNAESLEGLRKKFPKYSKLLRPGMILGSRQIEEEEESEELIIRAHICKEGLKHMLDQANKLVPILKSRIQRLNTVQFISQIIVAISGASILASIGENHEEAIKICIGVLTLLAGLLGLYVQHKSGTIALGENSLSKVFNNLTDYKLKAEHFSQELLIWEKLDFIGSSEDIAKVITESNMISLELKKIIEKS